MSNLIRRGEGLPARPSEHRIAGLPAAEAPLGWEDRDEVSLPGLFQFVRRLIWRRLWLILLVAAVVTGTAALQILTMSPLYKASARIQIQASGPLVLPYQDLPEAAADFLSTEAYVNTQKKILEGRALATRVAQRLELTRNAEFLSEPRPGVLLSWLSWMRGAIEGLLSSQPQPTGKDAAAQAVDILVENLEVAQLPGTRLLDIEYVFHQPELAYQIAESFVDEYSQMELAHWKEVSDKTARFLRDRLKELRGAIEESEKGLAEYARKESILALDQEQQIARQNLSELSSEMTRLRARLTALEARQEFLDSAGPASLPASLRTDTILELENKLLQLEQQNASLSARFGKNWPARLETEQELNQVRMQLSQERERVREQASQEYRTAQAHYRRLAAQLDRETRLANSASESLQRYSLLRTEAQSDKDLYEALRQRLQEVTVSSASEAGTVRLVEPAQMPRTPHWPRKGQALAIAWAVGLLFGFGIAVLIESMGKVLETPEEVEGYLGIACLGAIPKFRLPPQPGDLKALGDGSSPKPADVTQIIYGSVDAQGWEAYRSLRTSLLLSTSGGAPRTIMVTSALPTEGKTTTAVNTAISLAQTGARTLLIDLDLREARIAGLFGLEEGPGISLFLSGQSSLHSQLCNTRIPNLSILPAGLKPPNPAELIGSERMDLALTLLSEAFDMVIIDTPPVLPVTDAVVLSPKVDGAVLVVSWSRTSADIVRRASAALSNVGGRILGVVMNSVNSRRSSYGHYSAPYSGRRAS